MLLQSHFLKKRKTAWLLITLLFITGYQLTAQTLGAKDWVRQGGSWKKIGSSSTYLADNVRDMVTDSHGNVYVVSMNYGKIFIQGNIATPDTNGRYSLSSWDCNGNLRWVKALYGLGNVSIDKIEVDSNDGVYITGYLHLLASDTVHFDADTMFYDNFSNGYLVKYNSSGAMQWFKAPCQNAALLLSISRSCGMSVASSGDVYWYTYLNADVYDGGAFVMSNSGYCVVRYSSAGVYLDHQVLDITGNKVGQQNVIFNRDQNTQRHYMLGNFEGFGGKTVSIGSIPLSLSLNNYVMAAAAFGNSGSNIWVKQGRNDKFGSFFINNKNRLIAFDGDGNIYVSGSSDTGNVFNGDTIKSAGATGYFTAALDSMGNRLWFKPFRVNDFMYRNGRLLYVSEYYVGTLNSASGAMLALDSIENGSPIRSVGNIAVDKNNNLYVGGFFRDSLRFGANFINSTQRYSADWYLGKFKNTACNCDLLLPQFAYTKTGASGISFSYTGQSPYNTISWDFGDGSVQNFGSSTTHHYTFQGKYPVCVTVTNGCGSNTICHWVETVINPNFSIDNEIALKKLYPNPASNELYISNLPQGKIKIQLYNLQGQRVMEKHLIDNGQIDISKLPANTYFVHFVDDRGNRSTLGFMKE